MASEDSPADATTARDPDAATKAPAAGPGRGASPANAGADERTPNTALNALIGGVVTAATALFVPFSPVLGGALAGYLEGGDTNAGLRIGALAGLVAVVPLAILVPVALIFVPVFGPRGAFGLVFLVGVAVALVAVYTVGLSALGGVVGTYLEREL